MVSAMDGQEGLPDGVRDGRTGGVAWRYPRWTDKRGCLMVYAMDEQEGLPNGVRDGRRSIIMVMVEMAYRSPRRPGVE